METTDAAPIFGALAQESRLEVLRLLISSGSERVACARDFRAAGDPGLDHFLSSRRLERAGLIRATRQGRQIIYALRVVALRELLAFLTETCCGGRPELCGDLARLLPPTSRQRASR